VEIGLERRVPVMHHLDMWIKDYFVKPIPCLYQAVITQILILKTGPEDLCFQDNCLSGPGKINNLWITCGYKHIG
jgi:hypothetical protein